MKYFIILALCLSAVVAEELHDRGVDFHTLHYSQHHQSLEEAKKKISNVLDGQHAEFEEVGSYGGYGGYAGGVGVGTVGLSSSGLSGAEFGSSSGSNQFSSSAASNYGASRSANLASSSSSSFDSNANFASGTYGSAAHQYGSRGVSSGVVGSLAGTGSTSYLESSGHENVQQVVPETFVSSGVGGHDSYLRHEEHTSDRQVSTPLVYNVPSGGSEKYYLNQERRVSGAATPYIYTVPSTGGSENYVHHEEHRVQGQALPSSVIHYTSPSVSSEKIVEIKEDHVQQTPLQIISTPVGGQESYIKYRKVTSTASQPQVLVHASPSISSTYLQQSSSGSTTGSKLGSLVTGGLTGTSSNYHNGYFGNAGYTVPSSTFGSAALTTGNSNSFRTGFGSSHQASSNFDSSSAFGAGHQADFGTNSAYTDSSAFGSKFGSKFGSQLGAESSFGSGSSFGASSSVGASSGLHKYIQESDRLAQIQAQGMSVGGTRTSGSQFNSNLESDNTLGFGGFSGLSGVGAGNAGYKTKSWEKASKWSSQSEFGPDGQVNNFKKLSTGESENYDINGRRAGYQAATTTLDDNGKVSSYSLHT